MELATPQALARLLRRDKEDLLGAWERRVTKIPGAEQLPAAYLRDHMPHVLEELAEELERPETARQRVQAFSAAHGEQRHQVGLHLPQVVEEYKILRQCIIEHVEANGLTVAADANRVINELIDDGIKTAVETYIERRDNEEKSRRQEYLTFVVHDLRSPLTAIYYAILLAERDLQDTDVGERVRSIHSAIKRNIERMRALIVRLLQEERNIKTPHHVEVEREPVNLWPVTESAIRTLASMAAGSETHIINRVPRDLTIQADAELLERIFQNLIANAIEHTFKGQVTVGAAASTGGGVECWVSDNGRGIPADQRAAVFDKFVTGSKRRSGVGLGLAVVKQLVEAHGGTVDLQSEVGKGTTVRFTIPNA